MLGGQNLPFMNVSERPVIHAAFFKVFFRKRAVPGPKGYYLVRAANGEMSWEFKEAHDVLWEEIDLDIKAGRCAAKHQPDTCRAARRAQAGECIRCGFQK
jgi:hypothetical protein